MSELETHISWIHDAWQSICHIYWWPLGHSLKLFCSSRPMCKMRPWTWPELNLTWDLDLYLSLTTNIILQSSEVCLHLTPVGIRRTWEPTGGVWKWKVIQNLNPTIKSQDALLFLEIFLCYFDLIKPHLALLKWWYDPFLSDMLLLG